MKKRYTILPKNWFRFGLAAAFTISFSLSLQAQKAPAIRWDKTIGGSDIDKLISLQQTSDGGYILGGFSSSGISSDKSQSSKGLKDFWVVKLDVNGNKIWDKTFGGSGDDLLFSLKQTSDGGYILGGMSMSGISGDKTQASRGKEDYWVIKLDASGNKTWDKSFGGSETDELYSLQQTSDGGYIIGGISASGIGGDKSQASRGNHDHWVIKLDTNGNKTWDKTFGGNGFDGLYSLQQTSDGGYILGGSSESGISGEKTQPSKGDFDYWVVKLDINGTKLWDKTLGGNSFEYIKSLQQTSDGGYILAGTSDSGINGDKSQASKGNNDFWVIKLEANGNKLWDKTIGGSDYDEFSSLQQTSEGGFILGGSSSSAISGDKTQASQGYQDYWVVKLDASGSKTWDATFGGISSEVFTSLQQTSDGGYILGGFSNSPISVDKSQVSKGNFDYWIVKLAASPTGIKEPEASFNLSISPNPNHGQFNLQLSNLSTPKVAVTISDLVGRVVLQKEIQTTNNQLTEELTLPNAKGIYLLQLKAGEQIITRKIVVE